jgi:hypothetical protein
MHTVLAPSEAGARGTGVQEETTPSYLTATLYDLSTAIQDAAVGPRHCGRVGCALGEALRRWSTCGPSSGSTRSRETPWHASCQAGLPGLTRGEHEALSPSETLKLVKNFRPPGGKERQWTAEQS